MFTAAVFLIPAIASGFVLAHLLIWARRIFLERGQRQVDAMMKEVQQKVNESYEALYGRSPDLIITTAGKALTVVYDSSRCPGPHQGEMSAEAMEARAMFLTWLTERIRAQRFTEIRLRW